MVWKAITSIVKRVDAVLSGYGECRGVFRVMDPEGSLLSDVTVSYKVGESDWVPCGHSSGASSESNNFTQLSTIYYRIGEPVSWRFQKDGFEDVLVVRYTADKAFDEKLNTIVMSVCEDMAMAR